MIVCSSFFSHVLILLIRPLCIKYDTVVFIWLMFTFTSSSPVDKWSPALQIRTVLLSIQALLSAPNPDDPLANDVAEQWKSNEAQAIETGQICGTSRAFYVAI